MSSDSPALSAPSAARNAVSLRLTGRFERLEDLRFDLVTGPIAAGAPGDAVVEVHAAAVNPSDVKAALGMMPYAVFPRTPGRDFAGIVIDGPPELLGTPVFGSSGDLGIRRDGAHATHVSVAPAALVAKPPNLTMEEAAGLGVPFVTAIEGFRRAGMPGPGDTVLVLGLSGRVGQAAAQIALWLGASVIGVSRRPTVFNLHGGAEVALVDSSREDALARVRELTDGHGADIVFNTVGEPYYQLGVEAAALKGRLIFIASFREASTFDIFAFYRRQHTYVGIDTLALSSQESGTRLRELLPGFAGGRLAPFPTPPDAIYALEDAATAFRAVMEPSSPRIILRPRR